jgi:hypothetical protein
VDANSNKHQLDSKDQENWDAAFPFHLSFGVGFYIPLPATSLPSSHFPGDVSVDPGWI